MGTLGLVQGWFLMTTLSLLSCAYLFWRYDRDGVDWLFANAAKEWEEGVNDDSGRFKRLVAKLLSSKRGLKGVGTFILASIYVDALIVAVHYRESHFSGIRSRDWFLLFSTVVIGNIWWGIRIGLLVEILKWLAEHFWSR
ncbi:MAG: hypothetical protein V4690_00900 [Patescibacteria group bacterium]